MQIPGNFNFGQYGKYIKTEAQKAVGGGRYIPVAPITKSAQGIGLLALGLANMAMVTRLNADETNGADNLDMFISTKKFNDRIETVNPTMKNESGVPLMAAALMKRIVTDKLNNPEKTEIKAEPQEPPKKGKKDFATLLGEYFNASETSNRLYDEVELELDAMERDFLKKFNTYKNYLKEIPQEKEEEKSEEKPETQSETLSKDAIELLKPHISNIAKNMEPNVSQEDLDNIEIDEQLDEILEEAAGKDKYEVFDIKDAILQAEHVSLDELLELDENEQKMEEADEMLADVFSELEKNPLAGFTPEQLKNIVQGIAENSEIIDKEEFLERINNANKPTLEEVGNMLKLLATRMRIDEFSEKRDLEESLNNILLHGTIPGNGKFKIITPDPNTDAREYDLTEGIRKNGVPTYFMSKSVKMPENPFAELDEISERLEAKSKELDELMRRAEEQFLSKDPSKTEPPESTLSDGVANPNENTNKKNKPNRE